MFKGEIIDLLLIIICPGMSDEEAVHFIEAADAEKLQYETKCREVTDKLARKGALNFIVCIDGSDAADTAFHAVLSLRRKFDFIGIFHAAKDDESNIPGQFHAAAIESRYDVELVTKFLSRDYGILIEPREGRTFMKTLSDSISQYAHGSVIQMLHNHDPDFIVMGYTII